MDNSGKKEFEGTMVDLGEDLLEASREKENEPMIVPAVTASQNTEQEELQRGEILMSEKLLDDAKKVFRKILRRDPGSASAKKFLDEIQKIEIQELLGAEAPRKLLSNQHQEHADAPTVILEKLEKDLHFSIAKSELKPVPDLFKTTEEYASYCANLIAKVVSLPVRDRIDIGVAHLEMGLFNVAQEIFESVVRYDDYRIPGNYLLALSLIYGGKAIEATLRLEPLARDLSISESQKTDFLYLMALAFEELSDSRKAREFYRRVFLLNPKYRDVVEKLK